jgi:hypothetical protein
MVRAAIASSAVPAHVTASNAARGTPSTVRRPGRTEWSPTHSPDRQARRSSSVTFDRPEAAVDISRLWRTGAGVHPGGGRPVFA